MELAISVPKEVMLMARWILRSIGFQQLIDFGLDLLAGGFSSLVFIYVKGDDIEHRNQAELAQSVERTTLNRVVEGSIPSFGGESFGLPFAPSRPSPDHGLSFGPI